jgi:hypothetical protein
MRRFVTVVALLFFTIPFGISVTGCGKKAAVTYCNGQDAGISVGQVTTITLQPKIYGISMNQGAITSVSTPTATDCKGNSASVRSYTYGSSDTTMSIVDVQPSSGRLCGGTWNRNTGGGVADFTTCTATGKSGIVYITATAGGVSSNPIPVFVHPIVNSVVLGTPSTDCTSLDPASNCSPASVNSAVATSAISGCPTSAQYPSNPVVAATGCCSISPGTVYATTVVPVTPYDGKSCVSQGVTRQLAARTYAGTAGNQTNVSCLVGHLTFAAQTALVANIDQNGVATANQPGSTIVNATVSQSGSSAGFFSTCPPVDIALSYPGSPAGTTNIIVNPNNTQPITATATDANGTPMTGLALEYVSTTPITIPASSNGTVTPVFPGEAAISAICQPPSCNPAPQSALGLFGNGKPVASKALTVTTPGTNSTDLFIASTDSQYVVGVDFTQTQIGAPVRLPYVPNSMLISNDGTAIYFGSSTELMAINPLNDAITRQDTSVPGKLLAISPNNATIVISDPVRGQTYLYSSSGSILTSYGGVGTHAAWSPDSQTVYIAAGDQILVYSSFSGWKDINPATTDGSTVTDVTSTVPSVGAYFSGATTTARGYCPVTSTNLATTPPTTSNQFYPPADSVAALTDRLAATNDGFHIIGASATPAMLNDIEVSLAPIAVSAGTPNGTRSPSGGIVCPADGSALTFSNTFAPVALSTSQAPITPTAITGVLPTSDSTTAFVTYTGTGGYLPAYQPPNLSPSGNTSGVGIAGKLTSIKLSGSAIAPVAGAISADNSTIYVGTTGDNLVHIISKGTLTDTRTIAPNLPSASGGTGAIATPNLLVEKPRPST